MAQYDTYHRKNGFTERRDRSSLTAEYEDFGLFKSDIVQIELQLTPVVYRNSRLDLIVQGVCAQSQPFEVSFAGRRSSMADPLIANLEALKSSVVHELSPQSTAPALIENLRVPIAVQGAWRRRFWLEADGWQSHIHQLVAARWSLKGPAGRSLTFGVLPFGSAGSPVPIH